MPRQRVRSLRRRKQGAAAGYSAPQLPATARRSCQLQRAAAASYSAPQLAATARRSCQLQRAAAASYSAPQLPDAHAIVRHVVGAFLHAVDVAAPGLVEGLYLTGSVALADFRPHQSDIDFVAVTPARPDLSALGVLRRVHAQLQAHYPRPYFDGVYVTRADLRRDPARAIPAPCAHEGRVAVAAFGLDPVTWHTLAGHGVPVRGPAPAAIEIWADPAVLAAWTLGNLDTYWRRWHALRARWYCPSGLLALGTWAPAWGVLGVTRLHYTLTTGQITSKTGAGRYALATFAARWHRVVRECLRLRRGEAGPSLYRTPLARRRAALDYIAMVLDDAGGLDLGRAASPAR